MIRNTYKGRLITFEGLDGSGLTTQATMLWQWIEEKHGAKAALTKEPTDGPAGGQIRLALEGRLQIDEDTLALLFAADRMDHLHRQIIPRLRDGVHVICDRYYLSSLAYQSLQIADFDWLLAINSKAIQPDLTIVLEVPPSECVRRMAKERFGVARYEYEPELAKVWKAYTRVIPKLQATGETILRIDAKNLPTDRVRKMVLEVSRQLIQNGTMGRANRMQQPQALFK